MCHKIIPIDSIITGDRIRKDLGDIQSLANSIREVGLISSIVVNEEYKLLAGERRLSACKLLGWSEVEVSIINTADAEKELTIEIAENNLRKSFTNEELVNAGISLERIEKIKAEERMCNSGNQYTERGVENLPQGKTRDIVATKLGMSGKQYERMKFIVQHKDEIPKEDHKEYDDWNNNRISTNKMYTDLKKLLTPITEKVKTKTVTVEKSPEDYEELKRKIDKLTEENFALTQENKDLEELINDTPTTTLPSSSQELVNVSQLESQITQKDNEITRLKKQLEDVKDHMKLLERNNDNLRSRVEDINNSWNPKYFSVPASRSLDDNSCLREYVSNATVLLNNILERAEDIRISRALKNNEQLRSDYLSFLDFMNEWLTRQYSRANKTVEIIDAIAI